MNQRNDPEPSKNTMAPARTRNVCCFSVQKKSFLAWERVAQAAKHDGEEKGNLLINNQKETRREMKNEWMKEAGKWLLAFLGWFAFGN